MPVKLSMAMIAKDDEATIGRALASVATFCDEMVVLDLGSKDATREVATAHGASVHSAEWHDDFSEARNESFRLCSNDWIMWLAASDVVPTTAVPAFVACKELLTDQLSAVDAIIAPYRWVVADDGTPVITFHRERIIRSSAGLAWEGKVHERIPLPPDNLGLTSDLIVEHRPDQEKLTREADVAIDLLEQAFDAGDRSPRTLFHFANELYDHGRYGEAVERYREYLDADPDGADRYWAHVFLAETLLVLEDPEAADTVARAALGEDSSRAEAYVVMGRVRYEAEDWQEAIPLFTAATAATRPELGLFREADYVYAPWDYLAVCFDKLDQVTNALACAQRALPGNPQADRVRSNMRWMVDRL